MSFQGYGSQSETLRIYVQVFIRHEKEIVFARRPQSAESGEYHCLLLPEYLFQLCKEIRKDSLRDLETDTV